MPTLLELTSSMESSYDEEDSHYFLSNYQFLKEWNCYSSKVYPIDEVVSLIETYILLHASVDIQQVGLSKFWTPKSLGVFRYVMDSEGSWHHVLKFNPFPGYTVQGQYWNNGFYYIVSSKDFLLEANLFVDNHTKIFHNYPTPS